MIKLKVVIHDVKTVENLATLQQRLEEVLRSFPHHYEVFHNEGGTISSSGHAIMSNVNTILAMHEEDDNA